MAVQPNEQTSREQTAPQTQMTEAQQIKELKAAIAVAETKAAAAEKAQADAEAKTAEAESAASAVIMAGGGYGTITVDHTGKVVS